MARPARRCLVVAAADAFNIDLTAVLETRDFTGINERADIGIASHQSGHDGLRIWHKLNLDVFDFGRVQNVAVVADKIHFTA